MPTCSCGFQLNEGAVVCPQCEKVVIDPTGLKRKAENRPAAEDKTQVLSRNFNGTHVVKQLSDGSFVCTCPSFLLQRGTQNGETPFTTCKHIRQFLAENPIPDYTGREPSDWQKLLLRTLGTGVEHLSNAQAYYLVSELLALRGISYPELTLFLRRQKKPNLLPLISFGVEIEGGVRNKSVLEDALREAGYPVAQTGYTGGTRGANEWRISQDASVRADSGFMPIEFVTPKLLGTRGLEKLSAALGAWNAIGANHNSSAGVHVHLDGYAADMDFRRRLAFNYAKIERQFLWFLVAPSRRRNSYCKALDTNFFIDLERNLNGRGDRYYSLNFNSLLRHGSVEVRLMNCTTDPTKLSAWVILLLRLYEATNNGLTYSQIPDNDFQGFLAAIGFNDSACSVLQRAKTSLVERFQYWKRDAEEKPNHVPQLQPLPLDNIGALAQIRALEDEEIEIGTILDQEDMTRRYHFVRRPDCAPANLFQLAAGNTQRDVDISTIVRADRDNGTVSLIVDGRPVTWHRAEDRLECTCSYARRNNNRCYHARWAARFLLNGILAERLEAVRAELAALRAEQAPAQTITPEVAQHEPLDEIYLEEAVNV